MGRADRSRDFAKKRNAQQRELIKAVRKDNDADDEEGSPKGSPRSAQQHKAPKSLQKAAPDAQSLFGDPVAWERAANTALIAAKRLLEQDASDANKQRYLQLKEEYKAAQKAKQLNAGPPKKNKPKGEKLCFKFQKGDCSRGDTCKFRHALAAAEEGAPAEEEDKWTCETCSITISSTMREAHEKSKKHAKKEKLAALLQEGQVTAVEDLMFTCYACQITIAASAQAAHEQGKKHCLRTESFKRGDWFCTACGQHNFASKTSCIAPRCHKPKPEDDIIEQQMASAARGAGSAAGKKRKREGDDDDEEEADGGSDAATISDQGSDDE